jgi:thiamine biosynthesis lipoprotein
MGGNIYALGKKQDKSLWKIGIADPKNVDKNAAVVEVSDTAVITSGNYERYFIISGKRYHHIIDPTNGYPAESGLNSATAIGKDATLCDILSTAMFVAGVEKSKELIKEYDIDAVLIDDGTVYYTKGLEDILKQTSDGYRYECIN